MAANLYKIGITTMQQKRLYISADIEGVAGVATREQTATDGFEYQQAREWMTNEVIAACDTAFSCGIDEIVISDSHGKGQNLLLDRLPENVQVVRSWHRPLCMMQGIEQGAFDAAILLGYHTSANDMKGVLAHTLSGHIRDVKLNGKSASETMISAATAAHFEVPVIMVSGDDAYAEHVQTLFDDIEVATVKLACSATSVQTLLPRDACRLISRHTERALTRLQDFKPYKLELPVTLEVDCVSRKAAELIDYLPIFERTTATTVQFVGQDMVQVSQVLSFLLHSGVLKF